jgi:hypothetical protein
MNSTLSSVILLTDDEALQIVGPAREALAALFYTQAISLTMTLLHRW